MTLITSNIKRIKIFGFSHKKLCAANVMPIPRKRHACKGAETWLMLFVCVSVSNANKSVSQIPLHAPHAAAIT